MNPDRSIEWLLAAYREHESNRPTQIQCDALVETLRDIDQVRELALIADDAIDPTIGRRFGDFQLLAQIGEGGMGQVFRAHHERLGREQALKLLPADRVGHRQALERFGREMRAIGRLSHPSIVMVHDAGQVDGTPYLTMELVVGKSFSMIVSQSLKEGRVISVQQACDWIAEAADGIQHAHDNHVLHRDIKPANLMLDQHGKVKILDLGLAKLIHDSGSIESPGGANDPQPTKKQQVLGTPDFMAPEQLSGNADERTDVYALAATLHYLLSGKVLFPEARNLVTKAVAVTSQPPPRLAELRPDISRELDDVIIQSLSKDPSDRPASATDFASMIQSVSKRDVSETTSPQITESHSRPLTRFAAGDFSWLWVATLPLGLAIAGWVFFLKGPDETELRVECEDPGVRIVATWAGASGKYPDHVITSEKSVRMRLGRWKLSLNGADANRYELAKNEVVLSSGTEQVVRITRCRSVYESDTFAGGDQVRERTATLPRVSDAEVLERLDSLVWTRGVPSDDLAGEIAEPMRIDGLPDWQLVSHIPVQRSQLMTVSPRGTYKILSNDRGRRLNYLQVVRVQDGKTVGLFRVSETSPLTFSWSPEESKFFVVKQDSRDAWIVDVSGRLLEAWAKHDPSATMDWQPAGKRILEASATKLVLKKLDGQVERVIEGGHVPSFPRRKIWSPNSKYIATRVQDENETSVKIYEVESGQLVLTQPCNHEPKGNQWWFSWHADGESFYVQHEDQVLRVLLDGQQLSLGQGVPNPVSVSPTGDYILSDHGKLFNRQEGLQLMGIGRGAGGLEHTARWENRDVFRMFQSKCAVSYSASRNEVIHQTWDRFPLNSKFVEWSDHGNHFITVPHIHHWNPGPSNWLFKWNPAGDGDTQPVQSETAWHHASNQIGWDRQREHFTAYHSDLEGKHRVLSTFDLSGRQLDEILVKDQAESITCSPFGNYLAFKTPAGDAKWDVVVLDKAGRSKRYRFDEAHETSQAARFGIMWSDDEEELLVELSHTSEQGLLRVKEGKQSTIKTIAWPPQSPDGKYTVLASPAGVVIGCQDDEKTVPTNSPLAFDSLSWSPGGDQFVTRDGQLVNANTGELIQLLGLSRSDGSFGWFDGGVFCGTGTEILIWKEFAQPPKRIRLPSTCYRLVSSLGMQPFGVSPDGRYLAAILCPGWDPNARNWGGNVCLVDLAAEKLLWVGMMFSDGEYALIEPTGRVRGLTPSTIDDYLTYVIRYPNQDSVRTRYVPLKRLQFASRIGLSREQQAVQMIIDLGGMVQANQKTYHSRNIKDARDLPRVEHITGVSLPSNEYINDQIAGEISRLVSIEHLDLSNTTGVESWGFLSKLSDLHSLNLSGCHVIDQDLLNIPSSVRRLDLSKTSITDFGLHDLANQPGLEKLIIGNLRISKAAIGRFQSLKPSCKIVTDEGW